jgi:glycosyltransferase involved in cell wall biosynthesis
MIKAEFPFILHVREIYDGSNEKVKENMKFARGAIFIDEATKEPFKNIIGEDHIVMNNPIDMTAVDEDADTAYRIRYGDLDRNTIFSLIGLLTENKGVHFVIDAFRSVKNDNARLLIVGKGDRKYISACRELAGNDERIIFWGEEPEIRKIYRLSDYIIRGEAYQCVGRTIYEGLYAGCAVIIPGTESRRDRIFEYDRFREKVYFYPPRSAEALEQILGQLAGEKIRDRVFLANTEEYVRSFHEFVVRTLGRSR